MFNILTSPQGDERMHTDTDVDIKMSSPVFGCESPVVDYMDVEDPYTTIVMASPTLSPALDVDMQLGDEPSFPPGLASWNNLAPALSWNGTSWVPQGQNNTCWATQPWDSQLTLSSEPAQPELAPDYRTSSLDSDVDDSDPSSNKDSPPLEQSARLGNLPPSPSLNITTAQGGNDMAVDNTPDDLDELCHLMQRLNISDSDDKDELCLLMQSLGVSDSDDKDITAGSSSGMERALRAPLTARARRAAYAMRQPPNKLSGRQHSTRYRTDKVHPGGLRKSKSEELVRYFKLGVTPPTQAITAARVESGVALAVKPLKKASKELHVEREVSAVLRVASGAEVRYVRLPIIIVPDEIAPEAIDSYVDSVLDSHIASYIASRSYSG